MVSSRETTRALTSGITEHAPAPARFVLIEEFDGKTDDAKRTRVVYTPARLHGFAEGERPRFSSARTGQGNVLLREWHVGDEMLGFTLTQEQR